MFNKEADFEKALIALLATKSWEKEVLRHPTEEKLIANWQEHLNKTNQHIDKLDVPLIRSEMNQILEQVQALKTPYALNGFINGKTVAIKRENEASRHFGKEVSLDIFDREEISAGKSRYQIAQQPHFTPRSDLYPKQRGDLMLLINGMPMFHIELKRSGVPISQATNQIERYHKAGAFSGIFSLVQVFVAMTPEECRYFANTGGPLNPAFYFRWADFNNVYMNDWDKVATHFLSIPMAHQFIGDYTIADAKDEQLKVLRSYQYYAVNKIADTVAKTDWTSGNQRGGYIWHTTGSGKTMSSFKSAQLISRRKDADKVIFLLDRIELGKQSLEEYQNFADSKDDVQATENTAILLAKLKSKQDRDRLIVTSIQKMSNIKAEEGVMRLTSSKSVANVWCLSLMKPTALLLAICCSPLSTPSPMRFSSALPARRLKKKTLRKVQPLPRFSVMNCTAIRLQTAFAMKMCWAFTPSISVPLKTAIYADLSLCKKPKQQMKAKYLPMTKRKKSTINL